MPRYWAFRTDRGAQDFIYAELRRGRLRQGWGHEEDHDLNKIRGLLREGRKLTDEQNACWRGNRRMHPDESDSIQRGDIILLPNLPTCGQWSVAEVVGGYRYEIAQPHGDYGHILDVSLLNPDSPINPNSQYVSAALRRTMTSQSRMWNLDYYEKDLQGLIDAMKTGKEVGAS